MRRHHRLLGIAVALVVGMAACGSGGPDESGANSSETASSTAPAKVVSVVTTTAHLSDFAKVVGGDRVRVYNVLKPNVDPHDFEPSPADLEALRTADVVVKNGVGLEQWFDSAIAAANPTGKIYDASTGVKIRAGDDEHDEDDGHEGEEGDPHIWHNPQNAILMATTVAQALETAAPDGKEVFQQRLADYVAQLNQLDVEIKSQIDALPNKKLVTNHDAFGYYVDRYGLEYVGAIIPSFDSSAELSARQISNLVAKIKATGTKAVFSESSIPPKTAEAIGKDAGVRVVAGEDALYGDTLGPEGSDGDTYLEMQRHNTKVIVDNLR